MRRRDVLAALGPALAGCASSPPPSRTTTATGTPLPGPITDCRTPPDPPGEPTRESALQFVRAHEEALVYNWLVAQNGGPEACHPPGPGSRARSRGVGAAGRIDVEAARAVVTAETDAGVYVVSSCSGEARYRCPDEGQLCSGARRNSDFVTHFVGDGRHVRVPDNWTACDVVEEPYRASDPEGNVDLPEGEPGLTFRVYDLATDRQANGEDADDGVPVDVMVIHTDSGDLVLHETYVPPHGPAEVTNVALRSGTYRLIATSRGDRTTRRFDLDGPEDSSLAGTCVYRGPGDDLLVVEAPTTGDLAPSTPLCYSRFLAERTETGEGA